MIFKYLVFPLILVVSLFAQPEKLPALKLKSLDGQEINSQSWNGQLVLLDFWATWCTACRASIPFLNELHQLFSEKGLHIAGISNDENRELVAKFAKRYQMNYPIYHDPQDLAGNACAVRSLPTIFLFDRDGKLLLRAQDLDQRVKVEIKKRIEAALQPR